jgi:DNA-binding IclR family transcriptional regulator
MKEYSVPALEKAIAILELLAASERALSSAEIYTPLGIPKATAFMVLNVLERYDMVRKQDNSRYTIGVKLFNLGITYISRLDIIEISRPHLEELMRTSGFTTHLAVLHDNRVLFIDKVEPTTFIRFSTFPGMRGDIHMSSLGKAIAAHLPADDLADIIAKSGFGVYTPNTITTMDALQQDLAKIRARGYATENEEGELGVRCVGAPIFDNRGAVVAAVSVTALCSQIAEEAFPSVGRIVRATADRISLELGHVEGRQPTIGRAEPLRQSLALR